MAGNLFIVGSIANIIVVEEAARQGFIVSWKEHLKTGLPVTIAEDPLTCVAIGTGRAMEDPMFRGVLQTA